MARTSAKAKKPKQDFNKSKTKMELEGKPEKVEDNKDSTDKENDDSSNYEVEKIVHSRIFRGKRQYLIRWKGYKEDGDTWETESALMSCPDILYAYKKESLGFDKKTKNEDADDSDAEDEKSAESEEEAKKGSNKHKTPVKKGKKSNITGKLKKDNQKAHTSTDTEEENEESSGEEQLKGKKRVSKDSNKKLEKRAKILFDESERKQAKKSKDSDSESITDGNNYEVEKILEVHTRKDKSREFLIRWKGYKPSDDTWEPEIHLDCQEMIDKFMEKVEKAKSLPMRELRESRSTTKRFIPHIRKGGNLRNAGFRPFYQE